MRAVAVSHDDLHPHTRLWFYALAWIDIDEAIRAARVCLHLMSKPPTREYFDHLELCVLRYGRPFAFTYTPTGKKKTRLDEEFVEIAELDKSLHERLMAMRDSVVAHSDMGKKSVRLRTLPLNGLPASRIECEPTWKLPDLDEVQRFRTISENAAQCLRDVCGRLLEVHSHELQRDAEGWLVPAPHPED